MNVGYRRLSDPEVTRYAPLLAALAAEERGRPGSRLAVQAGGFYGRFQGDRGATFVARDGARVIGFAILGYPPALDRIWLPHAAALGAEPADCGSAVQCVVEPRYRGCGVGGRFTALRVEHARRRGLRHLFSTVHPDNATSLRALSSAGFREIGRAVVYQERVLRVLLHLAL